MRSSNSPSARPSLAACLLGGLLLVFIDTSLQAATFNWSPLDPVDMRWSNPFNWDLGAIPGAGDDVVVEGGGILQLSAGDVTSQLGKVTVRGSIELAPSSSLTAQTLTIEPFGGISSAGGSLTILGGSTGSVVAGRMLLEGGLTDLSGAFQVTDTGLIIVSRNTPINFRNPSGPTVVDGTIDCDVGSLLGVTGTLLNRGTVEQRGRLVRASSSSGFTILNQGTWRVYSQPVGTGVGSTGEIFSNSGTLQTFGSPSIFYAFLSSRDTLVQIQGGGVETPGGNDCRPIVTVGPSNQTVSSGQTATFIVSAFFADSYRWQHGSEHFTTSSGVLTITGASAASGGVYTVIADNLFSRLSADMLSATLTVLGTAPQITQQPASKTVNVGQGVAFQVVAAGDSLSYQWLKEGQPLGGETAAVLSIASVSLSSAGSYSVVVSNLHGVVTSSPALLTVNPPPSILTPPAPVSVFENQSAHFEVLAAGISLSYQWAKDGFAIAGATSSSYDIASAQLYSEGDYTVTIINPSGSIVSVPAHLTIRPPSYLEGIVGELTGRIGSPAQQVNLSALQGSFGALMDTNLASRASQTSLNELQAKLDAMALPGLANSNLDTNLASRASQSSVDNASSSIASANAKLDSLAGSIASRTALDLANTGIASANSNLLSRASQASLDDLATNSLPALNSNISVRASQSSLDNANASITAANGKLDALTASVATKTVLDASVAGLNTKLDALGATTSGIATETSGLATQSALVSLQNGVNTRFTTAQSTLDTLQSSANSIATKIDSLQTANNFALDTNLLSRASEVMLNNVRTNLDAGLDLLSRLHIEHQLADPNGPRITMLFIPAAQGGLLEFVRDIVSDSILMSQAAGIAVGKASTFLTTANTAYSNRQYKTAYDDYAAAYQAVVK